MSDIVGFYYMQQPQQQNIIAHNFIKGIIFKNQMLIRKKFVTIKQTFSTAIHTSRKARVGCS